MNINFSGLRAGIEAGEIRLASQEETVLGAASLSNYIIVESGEMFHVIEYLGCTPQILPGFGELCGYQERLLARRMRARARRKAA